MWDISGNFVGIKANNMDYEENWSYTTSKIKEMLTEKGWSMTRLGDEINMEKANMSRLLSGKQRDMHYHTLFKIADALGVNMSELVR